MGIIVKSAESTTKATDIDVKIYHHYKHNPNNRRNPQMILEDRHESKKKK